MEHEVDLERCARDLLLGVDAVAAAEAHAEQAEAVRVAIRGVAHRRTIASATARVRAMAATSCTRTTSAPAAMASATRGRGALHPVLGGGAAEQLAEEPLAARPDQEWQAAERGLQLRQPMEKLEVVGRALAEADARVDEQPVARHPRPTAASIASPQPADTSGDDAAGASRLPRGCA